MPARCIIPSTTWQLGNHFYNENIIFLHRGGSTKAQPRLFMKFQTLTPETTEGWEASVHPVTGPVQSFIITDGAEEG